MITLSANRSIVQHDFGKLVDMVFDRKGASTEKIEMKVKLELKIINLNFSELKGANVKFNKSSIFCIFIKGLTHTLTL